MAHSLGHSDDSDAMEVDSDVPDSPPSKNHRVIRISQESDKEMDDVETRVLEETKYYDINQKLDDRRDIRRKYREWQDAAEARRANVENVTPDELTRVIMEAGELFGRVKQPQEAALDSRFLLTTAETAAAKARTLRIDKNAFDIKDFVNRIKSFAAGKTTFADAQDEEDEEEDEEDLGVRDKLAKRVEGWTRIGRLALQHSLRAPTTDFMLGPLSIEQKQRKVPEAEKDGQKKKKSQVIAQESQVQQLKDTDVQKDNQETERMIQSVKRYLDAASPEGQAVDFFEFVVNPHSFSQTADTDIVKVRDSFACLDTDNEDRPGELIVYSCRPPTEEQKQQGIDADEPLRKRQTILEMDMKTWREAIEIYGLTEPKYIPNRETPAVLTTKWIGG